jgi:hypothetical protein
MLVFTCIFSLISLGSTLLSKDGTSNCMSYLIATYTSTGYGDVVMKNSYLGAVMTFILCYCSKVVTDLSIRDFETKKLLRNRR